MADIFVAYSRSEEKTAATVCELLELEEPGLLPEVIAVQDAARDLVTPGVVVSPHGAEEIANPQPSRTVIILRHLSSACRHSATRWKPCRSCCSRW